jgi:DNA polymerase-3 subunit chi
VTEVDFHTLDGTNAQMRLHQACEFAERAYAQGQRVHILIEDVQEAARLDQMLWNFSDLAFVPHAVNPADSESWPVTIGLEPETAADRRWLVNLSSVMPGYYERYIHIDEIIDDAGKLAARERYRKYRERGASLRHFKLGDSAPAFVKEQTT